MKPYEVGRYLLFTACFVLVGCSRQSEEHREMLGALAAVKSELASRQGVPVRWAVASKHEIETAIFRWSREKMEAVKKTEALSPEIEAKVLQFESLQAELMRKKMEMMGVRLPL